MKNNLKKIFGFLALSGMLSPLFASADISDVVAGEQKTVLNRQQISYFTVDTKFQSVSVTDVHVFYDLKIATIQDIKKQLSDQLNIPVDDLLLRGFYRHTSMCLNGSTLFQKALKKCDYDKYGYKIYCLQNIRAIDNALLAFVYGSPQNQAVLRS